MIRRLACFVLCIAVVGADQGISISSDILSAADPLLQSVIAGKASPAALLSLLVCDIPARLTIIFIHYAGLDNSQPATQQVATQLAAKYQSTLQVCMPESSVSVHPLHCNKHVSGASILWMCGAQDTE